MRKEIPGRSCFVGGHVLWENMSCRSTCLQGGIFFSVVTAEKFIIKKKKKKLFPYFSIKKKKKKN